VPPVPAVPAAPPALVVDVAAPAAPVLDVVPLVVALLVVVLVVVELPVLPPAPELALEELVVGPLLKGLAVSDCEHAPQTSAPAPATVKRNPHGVAGLEERKGRMKPPWRIDLATIPESLGASHCVQ
jgi:hypothetical protein